MDKWTAVTIALVLCIGLWVPDLDHVHPTR